MLAKVGGDGQTVLSRVRRYPRKRRSCRGFLPKIDKDSVTYLIAQLAVETGIPPSEAWVDVFTGAVDADELYKDRSPMGGARGRLLVWQGSVRQDGTFYAVGFDPGTYTVVVPLSNKDASTLSERLASARYASVVVELGDGQETWVLIPFR